MNDALTIHNLNVRLGYFQLSIDELNIEKGTITGLIGKNGAGKTTLIKTILDCIQPDSGEILFDGLSMNENEEIVKTKIAVVYDSLIYPGYFTAKSLLSLVSPFYENFDKNNFFELLNLFQISPYSKLSQLSKGMQTKLSVAMAMAQNPQILFLDEPTSGLDPTARAEFLNILLEFMQDEDKAVFFSTHITSDLDKIADYIVLIDNGRIIFNEAKDDLLDKYVLVHIEKSALTEELYKSISGLKENAFGYEGLCSDKNLLEGKRGIRTARPTVEDILIYRGGLDAVKI